MIKPNNGCTCCECNEEHEEHAFIIVRLVVGALILGAYILFAHLLHVDISEPVKIGILFATFLFLGYDVLLRAARNILKGSVFDENFLMCVAAIAAFCVRSYEEAVGVMLFYQFGEFVQDLAVDKSKRSISELMDIRPDTACVLRNGKAETVDPADVRVGEMILVKPGEKVPLDGVIVEGITALDTRALTGESLPRDASVGDTVLSGSTNINGKIKVEVSKSFGESTASKILDLVQNASSRKAPSENFIANFARIYTPIVCGLALLVAVLPPLFVGEWAAWIKRGCTFLVISCPCALVLSVPLTFFAGIGSASHNGILIKGSNYLEALNGIDTMVFDKTGTLTKGEFSVTSIHPANGMTKEALLKLAAHAESFSNHPIAKSVMKAFGTEVRQAELEDYREIPGYGVSVRFMGKSLLCGNARLMAMHKIAISEPNAIGSKIYVAFEGRYAGCIVISDTLKQDTVRGIDAIKSHGIKTIMLTGDEKEIAEDISRKAHIDEYYAELLPTDKVEKIEALYGLGKNRKIAFVGDGINDAPALARSDVGIAMGGVGSDAAIEAADIVLMTDEISKMDQALKIARKTKQIVKENIVFALSVKMLFLICTAFGIGVFKSYAMWLAVFADVGVCVLAILNAVRVMIPEKNR